MNENQESPDLTQRAEGRRDQRLVREMTGYKTSDDYNLLWRLASETSVVCICKYQDMRDVAHTICHEFETHISARGITYASGRDEEEFAKDCKSSDVEFIVPNV